MLTFGDLQSVFDPRLGASPRNDHPGRVSIDYGAPKLKGHGVFHPNPPGCRGIRRVLDSKGRLIGYR